MYELILVKVALVSASVDERGPMSGSRRRACTFR